MGVGALAVTVTPRYLRWRGELIRRSLPLMGTVGEIAVVHRDNRFAQAAMDAAFAELRWVEQTMSRFRSDSDVGRANRRAHVEAVPVTPATAEVIEAALEWAYASDGVFDPALGGAVELWDVEHRDSPPGEREAAAYAGLSLFRKVDVDRAAAGTVVRFEDPAVKLDLGGIAKGYGVDRAVRVLRSWGIKDAIVNVGGDLYAMGRSSDGDPWRVGVRSARDPRRLSLHFELTEGGVATSGDYLRYFEHGGKRYHHLLDPGTGRPAQAPRHSVTVRAHTCFEADAATTTIFPMGTEMAISMLKQRDPHAVILSEA